MSYVGPRGLLACGIALASGSLLATTMSRSSRERPSRRTHSIRPGVPGAVSVGSATLSKMVIQQANRPAEAQVADAGVSTLSPGLLNVHLVSTTLPFGAAAWQSTTRARWTTSVEGVLKSRSDPATVMNPSINQRKGGVDPLTSLPLSGKTALVTGVSRRRGIGFGICRQLAESGANLVFSHFAPHDAFQPWGRDDIDAVRSELSEALTRGAMMSDISVDLAETDGPQTLIDQALGLTGKLDILVCNQAQSGSDGSILDATPAMLDSHFRVNTRATVMLTSLFARAFSGLSTLPSAKPGDVLSGPQELSEHQTGRVIWITSGQSRAMPGEVAYAMSKAALAGLTPTAAAELLPLGILLNVINPGPVNTGYLDHDSSDRAVETIEQVREAMPLKRFGHPDDVARLVEWLASDNARWIAGQVITSDGGFSLK